MAPMMELARAEMGQKALTLPLEGKEREESRNLQLVQPVLAAEVTAAVGMAAAVAAEVEEAVRIGRGHGHWARRSPNCSCHAAQSTGCTLNRHPMPASGTKRKVRRRLLAPLSRARHRAAATLSCRSRAAAHAA